MGVYVPYRHLRVPSVCFINGGKGRFVLLLNVYYKCKLLDSMQRYFKNCLKLVFIYEMANYVILKKYITVRGVVRYFTGRVPSFLLWNLNG